MKPGSLAIAVALVTISATLPPAPALAQDADGCFNARGCIDVQSNWGRDNRLNVQVSNLCASGVSVQLCGRRGGGRAPQCLFEWISGGRTWNTYITDAENSGRIAWRYVGSERSGGAWVCAGKVPGWHDPMF